MFSLWMQSRSHAKDKAESPYSLSEICSCQLGLGRTGRERGILLDFILEDVGYLYFCLFFPTCIIRTSANSVVLDFMFYLMYIFRFFLVLFFLHYVGLNLGFFSHS